MIKRPISFSIVVGDPANSISGSLTFIVPTLLLNLFYLQHTWKVFGSLPPAAYLHSRPGCGQHVQGTYSFLLLFLSDSIKYGVSRIFFLAQEICL